MSFDVSGKLTEFHIFRKPDGSSFVVFNLNEESTKAWIRNGMEKEAEVKMHIHDVPSFPINITVQG
jgi:hypothetical protein